MATWTDETKSTTNVTWANTLLDWTSILEWIQFAFFQNQTKH